MANNTYTADYVRSVLNKRKNEKMDTSQPSHVFTAEYVQNVIDGKKQTEIPVLKGTPSNAGVKGSSQTNRNSRSGLDEGALRRTTNKNSVTTEKEPVWGNLGKFAKMASNTLLGDEQGNTWIDYIMNPALLDGGTSKKPAFDMSTETQTVEYTPEGLPYLTEKKPNKNAEAFTKNLLYNFPGAKMVVGAVDKYVDPLLGTNFADSQGMKQEVQKLQEENKAASVAGALGGNIAGYYVGGQLVNSVPAIANMTGRAANTVANALTGGKMSAQAVQMGAKPLQNIIADSSLDMAFDVVPQLGVMAGQGATGKEVAKQALGKTAENVALNTVGEAIPMAWDVLKEYRRAKKAGKNLAEKIPELNAKIPELEGAEELGVHSAKINTGKKITDPVEKAMLQPDVAQTHTAEELANMQEYLNAGDEGIVQYAKEVRSLKGNQKISDYPLSDVSERQAEDIIKLTGIDVSGNKVVLDKGAIQHIDNRHGVNGIADHSMADDTTLSRIQYVLDSYDEAGIGKSTGKLRTKDGKKSPTVVFQKKVDGQYYVVEAITDADTHTNRIVSAYTSTKKVVDNKSTTKATNPMVNADNISPLPRTSVTEADSVANGAYQMANADIQSPSPTSKNGFEFTPNSNIPTNVENVKIPYLGDGVNFGRKVLEESHSKNIGKGKVNNVDEAVQNAFIDNPNLYTQLSNADTMAKAQQIYDSGNARSEIYRMLDQKDPAAIPLGNKIVGELIEEGRKDEAVELLRTMSTKLRESGQFSQAAAITMIKSDPETALRYVVRNIDDMNAAGKKKFGSKWKDFELTDAEAELFSKIKPGDTEAIKEAFESVGVRLAKEYPATMWEKVVELSRVGMLLNPRTGIRNFVSNALLQPVRSLTDRVSALGQNAIHLINPDFKVTQSLTGGGKQEKQLATEVWNSLKDSILENTSRYEDVKSAVKDKQIFKGTKASKLAYETASKIKDSKIGKKTTEAFDKMFPKAMEKVRDVVGENLNEDSLLETARNFTYYLLEKGDEPFVKNNFVNRLASYMKAQGIKNIDEIPEDAIMLAKDEALKATFKDDNNFTNMLSSIKKNLGKGGEVIMPFTKTPANLAMRGIDYSPVGFVNTFKKAKNGADVGRIMDDFSKNVTGTAAIALGYYLTKEGIITGALSSDKDEAAFQKQQGQLAYSIKVGDNYYSYDWAQPAAIPFILGASIAQSIEESDNEEKTALEKLEGIWNIGQQAVTSAADAWVELSPLQTLSDIFNTQYGSVPENFINEVLEFPQRFIPAALGAAARTVDTTQRQTYSAGNPIRTQIDTAKSKIPFLSKTLPAAYDTWGREIKRNDSVGEAAFAQMLNPGTLGNNVSTPIDGEIQRLYEATEDKAVFPRKSEWKVNGERLTNQEYSELQKEQGRLSYEMIETFMNNDSYSELSDHTKAKTIADMYSLTKALAENSVMDKPISDDYVKYADAYNTYGADGVVQFATLKATADTDGNGSLTQEEVTRVLDSTGLSRAAKKYYYYLVNSGWKTGPYD